MGERVIKTGLSKKYKDMLDAVIVQMSDGYWENTPMMQGYWKFVKTGTAGNEVTLNVDETSGARYGDSRIDNRFYGMPDEAVKKFFADKIKFLVKEEVGPWERDNEATTDYLSYGEPRYRVKDCYYAYEILKGRNARKHPEYGDVAESFSESSISKGQRIMGIKLIKKNESYESDLEDIAQTSGEINYNDAWKLDDAAKDRAFRKKVRDLINDWKGAAEDGDEEEMTKAAKALKTLADSLPKSEARSHLGRCKNCGSGWTKTNYLDELEPDVRKYFKDKGYADNADICPKCVAAAKKYLTQGKVEGATYDEYVDAVAASLEDDFEYSPITALEFARDDFKDITKACYGATKDPKEAAKEIDAKYMGGNESRKKAEDHEGWDGWEEVEGLEDTIEGIENLAYELRNCIRGAKTRCKDWKSLARYIKGLASNLDDAAELMAYKTDSDDDDDESANESKKKKKNPSKDFSSTVEEDEDGRKKSH